MLTGNNLKICVGADFEKCSTLFKDQVEQHTLSQGWAREWGNFLRLLIYFDTTHTQQSQSTK